MHDNLARGRAEPREYWKDEGRHRMKARYFCENCGAEVRAGAASCPSCGRVFTAVRCPQCGFEGRAPDFARGCPSCGFMEEKKSAPPGKGTPKSGAPRPAAVRSARRRPAPSRASLSPRFYRVAGIVLLALVVILVALLFFRR